MQLRKVAIKVMMIFISLLSMHSAYAIREPRATSMDSRIRVLTYNPNDVFKYIGYYGYQGSIQLEDGETIDTISMGDTVSWQMVPSGNRIFLKPIEPDATTNMTLITNKRIYFFELHAKQAKNINDPGLVFAVKFLYPDSNGGLNFASNLGPSVPDLTTKENRAKYNFKYSISGSDLIAPVQIFDDGTFTYFKFRNKNAAVPGIFEVDKQGLESITNFQVVGEYIVVEMVAKKFTLRYGKEITCVFNES
jgi:type IV secretion system protein VirB9